MPPPGKAADQILGVIERPGADGRAIGTRHLMVEGWVFSPAGIDSLRLYCDDHEVSTPTQWTTREDIAACFGQDTGQSSVRGFSAVLDLAGLRFGAHRIHVRAFNRVGLQHEMTREFRTAPVDFVYRLWLDGLTRTAQPSASLHARGLGSCSSDTVSLIVDVASARQARGLWKTLQSIDAQLHPPLEVVVRWGLAEREAPMVLTDDSAERKSGSPPLKLAHGHIDEALRLCSADLVGMLAGGDLLDSVAISAVLRNRKQRPGMGLIYADHDHCDANGRRGAPCFKPAWSPILLQGSGYVGRPWFAERPLLMAAASDVDTSRMDAELTLLLGVAANTEWVGHIAQPLLSSPIAGGPDAERHRPPSRRLQGTLTSGAARIRPMVSVIVPTRLAAPEVLTRCLDGLARCTEFGIFEILLVINNADAASNEQAVLGGQRVTLLRHAGPFNWSAINNHAARQARGDFLLFFNDDVEPSGTDWLPAMVALARRPDVGAVGAVLRYPDGRIQHAGVRLTANGRGHIESRHVFRHCRGDEPEVADLLAHDREVLAVTGACLMTRRELFASAGGFDETLSVVCNDVDFCLRLATMGFRSVVAAKALLVHHERLSRGAMPEADDTGLFDARWSKALLATDPYGNPNLRDDTDDWTLNPDARPSLTARVVAGSLTPRTLKKTDEAWEQWGAADPYFGVITDSRFRSANLDDKSKEVFFASGRAHVSHVLAVCRDHLQARFQPARVLDFGCGVGRLLLPFAKEAGDVVGLDVSESMRAEARRNCEREGLQNVCILDSDDELTALEGQFDLVHSYIVLQHIDEQRGRAIFQQLLHRIAPGGIGALHVTFAKSIHADTWGQPPDGGAPTRSQGIALPGFATVGGPPLLGPVGTELTHDAVSPPTPAAADTCADPEMQMNIYTLNPLLFQIQQLGVRKVFSELTNHGGELGTMLYFQRP